MPSIKQDTAQQKALNNIARQLDFVEAMNNVINGAAKDTFVGFGKGKGIIKIPIEAGSKEYPKLIRVVRDVRTRTVKEIQTQAAKFNIEMDKADMDIINGCDSADEPEAVTPYAQEGPEGEGEMPAYASETPTHQSQQMDFGAGYPADVGVPEEFM